MDKKTGTWESVTLRKVVEEYMMDPRFVGLSRYVVSVRFFWSYDIPTACAGHGFIFFNPDFFDTLPEETRKTVIVHEIWHLILRHLERGKLCDPYIHNIAADHVINLAITADGFTWDGFDPVMDIKYRNWSTEKIYNDIYNKPPEKKPKPDPNMVSAEQIEDMIQDALDADGKGKDLDDQKIKAEDDLQKNGPKPGDTPGNHNIVLEVSHKTVIMKDVSYEKIFEEFLIDPLSGGKRTFVRPNRRQHGVRSSLILPGRSKRRGHYNRLTHLTYALDVSGSITSKQRQQFHDSVRTIKEMLHPEKLTVLFFDTRIVLEKVFTDKQKYEEIRISAGGGTNLTGVYKRMSEIKSEALVIFTDLQVAIPPEQDWKTIWFVPSVNCSVPQNIYGDLYQIPEP